MPEVRGRVQRILDAEETSKAEKPAEQGEQITQEESEG